MATSIATYHQRGEALDYTNPSASDAIPAGAVIPLVSRIGVAGCDIPASAVGSVHVMGVFIIDKTESEDIKMGDPLYFDAETGKITKTGEGKVPAGFAAADSATEATTVAVNIGFPPATGAAAPTAAAKTKLSELDDVEISGEAADQVLTYDASGKWKNKAAAGAGA